ncbi:hypothetical protein NLJ89_g6393 [Agrocybe chaxingu]|uniref:Uncharacterized protein n=1 Tax=Agrocybe chaxingu TaxID=84603 RepID=A0A9W8JYQ7_9AGAR|nr:hypothetical protein NLJ89_g6393 [Agrocybe chaxingu]
MTHHKEDTDASSEAARIASARLIQRMWRGKNVNLAKDEYLNPESRWGDALNHAKLAVNRNAAIDGQNSPLKRWVRATYFVGQLKDKNKMLKEEGVEVDAEDKHLETQHWLELVDSKHRYGSNRSIMAEERIYLLMNVLVSDWKKSEFCTYLPSSVRATLASTLSE